VVEVGVATGECEKGRKLGHPLDYGGLFVSLVASNSDGFVFFQAFGTLHQKAILLQRKSGEYRAVVISAADLQSSKIQKGNIIADVGSRMHGNRPTFFQEWSAGQVATAIFNEDIIKSLPVIVALIQNAQRSDLAEIAEDSGAMNSAECEPNQNDRLDSGLSNSMLVVSEREDIFHGALPQFRNYNQKISLNFKMLSGTF
jgi:hypothetical protein